MSQVSKSNLMYQNQAIDNVKQKIKDSKEQETKKSG